MLVNAQIVLMRCKTNKKLSGIRIEQTENGSWKMNWAFPINEEIARNEGFDKTNLTADIYIDNEYPGCPICGAKGFVRCGSCGKLTCYDNEISLNCAWCSNFMDNITESDEFDLSVGDY